MNIIPCKKRHLQRTKQIRLLQGSYHRQRKLREIRKGLSKEPCALHALKAKPRYESDYSEAMETKQSFEQYKHAVKEVALCGLKNMSVENAAVSSPVQPPASKNSKNSKNHGRMPEN
jgi:hypothetical protein